MPPTIVAMNAISTMLTPIVGETVPVRAVSRIAAAAASTPESANADATTVFARIPSTRAMRKSSAAARICVPWVVRRKNSAMAASSASVTPMVIDVELLDHDVAERERAVETRTRSRSSAAASPTSAPRRSAAGS